MEKKKIAFHTFGCKLNFSETSFMSHTKGWEEFEQVDFNEKADFYVINSCAVTGKAEKRCRSLIRQVMKRNPSASVAVTGCYSQLDPAKLAEVDGVDIVLGNADKYNLFDHIKKIQTENTTPGDKKRNVAVEEPTGFVPVYSGEDRTRTFFKIQDGCDYFCTYCTVPNARGRSRSNTITATMQTASQIAKTNPKEVVLTGVNIGDFGRKNGQDFHGLLKELCISGLFERIRISSIEPNLLSDEIIKLVAAESSVMPHFHIPLQSGSDAILKSMGRRYDTRLFAERVKKIKSLMPDACIAVDLIVGFPGETEEDISKSVQLLEKLQVSYLHVFTYSERANTKANSFKEFVPVKTRNLRSKKMRDFSDQLKTKFYKNQLGKTETVLWESENINGYMYGFTTNYLKVKTLFSKEKMNQTEVIQLTQLCEDHVFCMDQKQS